MTSIISRIVRSALGRRSDAHRSAHQYWKDCSCTFLAADPAYYDRQELALRGLLQPLEPRPVAGLDVGCGNGRFSFVLGEFVSKVVAFDLSETLVNEAREKARAEGLTNVIFEARDLEQEFPSGLYGLVSCMGVTSTLIDEGIFESLIRKLHKSVESKGFLITKDSLSSGADRSITSGAYITIYRSARRYENQLVKAGFKLIQLQMLAEWDGLINKLYLWQKTE